MKMLLRIALFFIALAISRTSLVQAQDSTKVVYHFSGAASITNNGISLIPSFSLRKPAILFIFSMGGKRFSIDPDLRFGLDGRPWTFLFWARYKLFHEGRFRMNTGAHLGLNHRTTVLTSNGRETENIIVRRYLAGDLAPNYFIAKNISIGGYYLYSHGIDEGTVRNTHFLTVNSSFSPIPISRKVFARAIPQLYYLNQDGKAGYFFNASFTLALQNFPLSLSSIINKQLGSYIPGSRNFIWNASLVYSFNRNYMAMKNLL